MKRIDEYIEKIYKDIDVNDEDTEILKEEIREHLYDKVADCMKSGYTEEQSIELAINDFGDEESFSKEMKSIIVNQTKFTGILLKLSIIIFIIGCLLKVGGWCLEHQYRDNWDKTRPITVNDVMDDIKHILIEKDKLLENDKKDFDNILDNYNNKYDNGLYGVRILKDNVVYYEYKRAVPAELLDSGSGMTMSDNGWVIERKQTEVDSYRNIFVWNDIMRIKDVSNSTHFKLKNLGFWLISLSWILIVMYYTQKAILNDKLNKNIIVLLSLQTILIYATYTSDKDIIMPTVALFMFCNAIYPRILERLYKKKLLSV